MRANAQRDGRPLVRVLPLSECYKNQRTAGDVNRQSFDISIGMYDLGPDVIRNSNTS